MEIFDRTQKASNRSGGIVAAVVIHIILFGALVYGGRKVAINFVRPPLLVETLEEKRPAPAEAMSKVPSPKMLQPPQTYIPPPDIEVALPPSESATTISNITQTRPPPAPVQPVTRIGGQDRVGSVMVGPRFEYTGCELLEYPMEAMATRQQGVVTLLLLIDEKGNAIESKVAKSSGYPELDEAARVGMGNCKYRPGKIDGKVAVMWKKIRYDWELP